MQPKRRSCNGYTSAGAVFDDTADLYIDSRDDNMDAKHSGVSPEPLLWNNAFQSAGIKRNTLMKRLSRAVRRERGTAVLCICLLILALGLGGVCTHKAGQIYSDLRAIDVYRSKEQFFNEENAKLEALLGEAKNSDRIRNQAQNTLGMLRPEMAEKQVLSVCVHDDTDSDFLTADSVQFGTLDAMVSLVGLVERVADIIIP